MPAPEPPLQTGDIEADIEALFAYLQDLIAYLTSLE